ncbi:hypothetical protein N1236_02795 [Acetivibrio thermocellus]|uniref:hypothetical protein n=1 Tax=Acetivibrio thermocellus TaxID=1515 RepID=UPI0021ADD29C|nr:hypothetical protein [Acetivibrio thermocellus]UWV47465.1 hypothetical protein N1236_02795 [Acetivibrio thermocellus]
MKYLPFILAGGVFLFVPCAFLYSFFREQRFLRDVYNTEIIYGTLECFGRYRRGCRHSRSGYFEYDDNSNGFYHPVFIVSDGNRTYKVMNFFSRKDLDKQHIGQTFRLRYINRFQIERFKMDGFKISGFEKITYVIIDDDYEINKYIRWIKMNIYGCLFLAIVFSIPLLSILFLIYLSYSSGV